MSVCRVDWSGAGGSGYGLEVGEKRAVVGDEEIDDC